MSSERSHEDVIRETLVHFSEPTDDDTYRHAPYCSGCAAEASLDALVDERDRLAAALEAASVRLGELTQPPWNEFTPLVAEVRDSVREALGKGDTRAV